MQRCAFRVLLLQRRAVTVLLLQRCAVRVSDQIDSAQSLDRPSRRGDVRNELAEMLFHSFLREATARFSGMGSLHNGKLQFTVSRQ